MVVHKPKFGGKPKTGSKPPNKTVNKALGGLPPRKKAQDLTSSMDVGLGNRERGFIQNTPKKATAAFMGRPMPKLGAAKTGTRSDGKSQFKKAKGKKVF
jgi:hypothetical protein